MIQPEPYMSYDLLCKQFERFERGGDGQLICDCVMAPSLYLFTVVFSCLPRCLSLAEQISICWTCAAP